MGFWVPIDPDDLRQERAIALWQGTDPKTATRAYVDRERRYYNIILPAFHLEHEERFAIAPMVIIRPVRSPESIERRLAYSRAWWKKNGREYRKHRAEERARVMRLPH